MHVQQQYRLVLLGPLGIGLDKAEANTFSQLSQGQDLHEAQDPPRAKDWPGEQQDWCYSTEHVTLLKTWTSRRMHVTTYDHARTTSVLCQLWPIGRRMHKDDDVDRRKCILCIAHKTELNYELVFVIYVACSICSHFCYAMTLSWKDSYTSKITYKPQLHS